MSEPARRREPEWVDESDVYLIPREPKTREMRDKAAIERLALLTAGEEVIAEKGFARMTIQDVTAKAKLSPHLFYAHFQGKGALLRALNTRYVEEMIRAIDQVTRPGTWQGTPARDVIEVAARSLIEIVIDRQALVRAFLAHGATDRSLPAGLRRIGAHLTSRLVAVLAECSGAPARPSRVVAYALLVPVALAHHYILVGDDWSGVAFSKEQLAEETARLISAYLGLEPTIAILDAVPDNAPTLTVAALRSRRR